MNAHYFRILVLFALFQLFEFSASAQNPAYWQEQRSENVEPIGSTVADYFRPINLDFAAMKALLDKAPDEYSVMLNTSGIVIELPLPYGGFEKFRVLSTSMMEDGLKQNAQGMKTFIATGIDDPYAIARLDYTPLGFHAMVMSPTKTTVIDPVSIGNTQNYICYDKRDLHIDRTLECYSGDLDLKAPPSLPASVFRTSGTQLRTYRLAVACTGDFGSAFGTVNSALAAILTLMNRVNLIYESEAAIRFTLVANNTSIIYMDPLTDPYSEPSASTMIGQNQTTITSVIGSANYDIGHLFAIGTNGGLATLSSVCSSSNKARGVSGTNNIGLLYVMVVAHEMGHQFSADHSFNSSSGDCSNRNASTAYEPGSGSTLMSYAIANCNSDNLQSGSDLYFNIKSFDDISIYSTTGTGSTCGTLTATGNSAPVVSAGANYTIPTGTPFTLTGSATDANGDALTYSWEEYDLGNAGAPGSPVGNAPIFRVFNPEYIPSRTFPKLSNIVNNTSTIGEILPTYARTLNFRLMARDGRNSGGGVGNNDTPIQVVVTNTGSAFTVTAPNTAVVWTGGSAQTVSWNVAGTTAAPITCANVNIKLSTDGGYTYPITILSNTPNDGTQAITVPNVNTSLARIRVEGAGNIFFDISNVNFTITTAGATLSAISTSAIATLNYCAGSTLSVTYTTNANANAGNVYTAQLSNAYGSFASPTTIGSVSATAPTAISCTIPAVPTKGTYYRIRVVSSNPVVNGTDNGSNIGIYPVPLAPGSITGAATVCQNSNGFSYSIAPVTNAVTYNWSFPYGFNSLIFSGPMLMGNIAIYAGSGTISVAGANPGCVGPSSSMAVTVNPVPGNTTQITGPTQVCQGTNGVTYSIAAVSGSTGYQWIVPSGATITSGLNTNSIAVNYSAGATSGYVGVAAENACGIGRPTYGAVSVYASPASPTVTPTGPLTLCNGSTANLSVVNDPPTTYNWRNGTVDIPLATASTYTTSATGSYDVRATRSYPSTTSQVFTNPTVYNIPDGSCNPVASQINVTGYNGFINTANISVKVNINHTWVGDVIFFLEASNGARTLLSYRGGNDANNSGDNFVNTIFSDAGSTIVLPGGAPYTGTYKPHGLVYTGCGWSTLNTSFAGIGGGSINPNGAWVLYALDVVGGDVGTIQNWSLTLPAASGSNCSVLSTNTVNINTQTSATVSSFTPGNGPVTTSVIITGSNFINVTNVSFNGTAATYTVNSPTQITATVPAGATTGIISVTTTCGTANSSSVFTVGLPSVTLNLNMFFQGFYKGSQLMNGALSPVNADSVEVQLYDSLMAFAFSSKVIVSTAGNANVIVTGIPFNKGYYILLKHRNCLDTWSSTRLVLDAPTKIYDFTTSAAAAAGSNLKALGDGFFALYSGDVNKNGTIDFADHTVLENHTPALVNVYHSSDLTGDNIVESADYSLIENNLPLLLTVIMP